MAHGLIKYPDTQKKGLFSGALPRVTDNLPMPTCATAPSFPGAVPARVCEVPSIPNY